MNNLLKSLLTCSILSLLISSSRAAYTEITTWGIDDTYSGPFYVMTVNAQIHGDFYIRTDWDVSYSYEVTGQDENGDDIIEQVTNYSNPRNIYGVTPPEDWLGRSISVSWDGAISWTSFKPFLTDNGQMAFVSGDGGPGNPQVNPAASASLLGNNILIGRWWDQPSKVLFTLSTWDTGDPAWPAIGMDFMASAKDVFWRWIHPANDPTRAEIAMDLDYLHRLTLRKRGGPSSQRIVIDPDAGKITVNGQTVLANPAAADSRSVTLGYHTMALGYGQTVVGVNNLAVGNATNASDAQSEVFVVGGGTYGVNGVANQASNAFTVKRNGDGMLAGALAMEKGTSLGAQANASGQLVLGNYNDTRTNDGGVDHTKGALIIGNGTDASHRSNSLRVLEDGTVLIPERGDLSMGPFTGGPQP